MRPLLTQAGQVWSCATPVAPVGASYQLPRPLQLEHVIDPEPPHGEQGTVLVEEEAAPCGKPLVGPEGAALKRRRTIHATGFSPDRKSTRLNSSHRCIS